jgi:hypothetical protein
MASGSPSIPASPPSTRDAAALPGWLLPGLGLIVAGAGAGAWVVRRRRNARYRGARPMRRR